jgi:hypothetical protein
VTPPKRVDQVEDVVKGNKFNFVGNAKNHLINVKKVNTKKGIVGGHKWMN